jgi:thiol-disulfide isomerase/thioredoxin
MGVAILFSAAPSFGVTAVPSTAGAASDGDASDPSVDVILFWGDGCPRCEDEQAWLETISAEYPDIVIRQYEVYNNADNRALFEATGADLGFEAANVPVTVIAERVWIGWTPSIADDVSKAFELVDGGKTPPPGVYGTAGAGTCSEDALICTPGDDGLTVDVPFLGEVSLGDKSLLMSTLVIGFVDGVNPCSLWVISVLLTIVIRTASRRRVIAIGSAFLVVTAGMYALYMAGIYSALTVVGFVGKIQVIVAVVAGIFGAVSLKDYFAFKKGLSFTISDSSKPGIYKRVRDAAGHHALIPALAATVVLAVAVSLIETPCTAGFPVLWTGMLQAKGVGLAETAVLFVAYMIPFLLDEMIVFGIAVATMRATKMQEKHGEMLKLVAGVTMLALAGTMVFFPGVMEEPVSALMLFVVAFAVAGMIHLVTTVIRRRRVGASTSAT